MPLGFCPQNCLFFGQLSLVTWSLYPKPPVFRTAHSRRLKFVPKTACFSDSSLSSLEVCTQNCLFFGQLALATWSLSPKPPVFRTALSRRLGFVPKTACFSDSSWAVLFSDFVACASVYRPQKKGCKNSPSPQAVFAFFNGN